MMTKMIHMMNFVCFCVVVQEGGDDDDDDDNLCLFLYGYPGRQLQ